MSYQYGVYQEIKQNQKNDLYFYRLEIETWKTNLQEKYRA